MNRIARGFGVGLAVVVLTIVPACKSKKTKGPIVAPQDTMVPPQITIPPNTTTTETPVPSPTDFVRDPEPVVTTTQLPTNIEDLNRVAMDRGYIQDAFFGYDESTLSSEAQGALTVSANWLKQNPRYNLLIEGHTDERGTTQYNLALGDRRANIVKDYLSTLGVDAARLRTVSYGEEKPFDPDHDESAYAKNRRAHLVIVGQ